MQAGYDIRLARADELILLPEIERQAAVRFAEFGLAEVMADTATPIELLHEQHAAGRVWVAVDAGDRPVGFALMSMLDGHAHLDELDVLPEHGCRGIGTALVETVCAWARGAGYAAVTLSTLRDVPWNAPFYAGLGFRILAETEYSPALRELLNGETDRGLPMESRVLMQREL